jgi:hypothetical protein
MKPLMRWVVGKPHQIGIDILKESVKSVKRLYGESFDYLICYNGCTPHDLKRLKRIEVPLYNQEQWINTLSIPPASIKYQGGTAWKIYPPRIRKDSHEIRLDNDVVIRKRMPAIERFLQSSTLSLMTEGRLRRFGCFDRFIPKKKKLNSGFCAFPPYYDLESDIMHYIKVQKLTQWSSHFDEQGLISACLFKRDDYEIITLKDIPVLATEYRKGKYGEHYVGANGGLDTYWNQRIKTLY